MIAAAPDLGIEGDETVGEIDGNKALFDAVEAMRLEAGQRMGLGDVTQAVVPKVALLSPARKGGTLCSRYLTPWRCHQTHAVTGGLCLAASSGMSETVTHSVVGQTDRMERRVQIEHPTGELEITVKGQGTDVVASVTRTARLLFRGEVYVPSSELVA